VLASKTETRENTMVGIHGVEKREQNEQKPITANKKEENYDNT